MTPEVDDRLDAYRNARARGVIDPPSETRCGNPRHPNGPWHKATPLPLSVGMWTVFTRKGRALRREVRRYELRRRLWGCGCTVIVR